VLEILILAMLRFRAKNGSQHFNILVCPICKLELVSYARRAVELRRSATADASAPSAIITEPKSAVMAAP
jgi:hypothetical protein